MSRRRLGALVSAVAPDGGAARAGVRAGDRLLAIDGHEVRDVLDVAWLEAEGVETLTVRRGGQASEAVVGGATWLGLTFESSVFDGVRTCSNSCSFCFVDQLPDGLRPSLYLKDDDYRLSFLYGNFITLTNLCEEDVGRIAAQRLSPLYVSWHASDPRARRALFGGGRDRAPVALRRLLEEGIEVHVQIVVCPAVNDRAVLAATLEDLWARGPGVRSVGVVPVGRSAVGELRGAPPPPGPKRSRTLLSELKSWQRRGRDERGAAWVWGADEWYLAAGLTLPPVGHYADFPQLGNGVGLSRLFVTQVRRATARGRRLPARRASILTGELAAPVMREAAERVARTVGPRLDVVPVANRLFGGDVSVTGLLGGAELLEAVATAAGRGPVLIPDIVFEPGGRTLDGVAREAIVARGKGRCHVVPSDGVGFVRSLRRGAWLA